MHENIQDCYVCEIVVELQYNCPLLKIRASEATEDSYPFNAVWKRIMPHKKSIFERSQEDGTTNRK